MHCVKHNTRQHTLTFQRKANITVRSLYMPFNQLGHGALMYQKSHRVKLSSTEDTIAEASRVAGPSRIHSIWAEGPVTFVAIFTASLFMLLFLTHAPCHIMVHKTECSDTTKMETQHGLIIHPYQNTFMHTVCSTSNKKWPHAQVVIHMYIIFTTGNTSYTLT